MPLALSREKDRRPPQTPIPKLNWTETTAASAPLQACTHPATRTERLPDSHLHHSRLTCVVCGKHLRWLPRPETIERQRLSAFRLSKLAMRPDLSNWERSFVRDVSKLAKLHLASKCSLSGS